MKTRNFAISKWFLNDYNRIISYNYNHFGDSITEGVIDSIYSVLSKLKQEVITGLYLGNVRYRVSGSTGFEDIAVYSIGVYNDSPFSIVFLMTKNVDIFIFGLYGSTMNIDGILHDKLYMNIDRGNGGRFDYLHKPKKKRNGKIRKTITNEFYTKLLNRLRRERLLERRLKYLERLEYLERLRRYRRLYGA